MYLNMYIYEYFRAANSFELLLQEKNETRREEQRKFGVFFDDDYDYMQHLKDTDEIHEVEMVDGRIAQEENMKVNVDIFRLVKY